MSSTDERKIPKIVLKINRNDPSANLSQENEPIESIYSSKAAELLKNNKNIPNSIPLSILIRRVNQNAHKSLENVLEL